MAERTLLEISEEVVAKTLQANEEQGTGISDVLELYGVNVDEFVELMRAQTTRFHESLERSGGDIVRALTPQLVAAILTGVEIGREQEKG